MTNWKSVVCGDDFTLAIKTDGTLWSWGNNTNGQLGNGTVNIYYSSPIQVGSLTNWKYVSCAKSVMAIKTDGTLWAWGPNPIGSGVLGNGTTTPYSSPIQIGSLTTWKQVVTGYQSTIAIQAPDLPD